MSEEIKEVEVEILPNENCKAIVATGEILEDEEKSTMEDIIKEADEKNSERIAKDLQTLGNEYERALNLVEEGKLECKSIIEQAKEVGITKGMIETYISMKNYTDLNKFAIMGAINEK